MSPESEEETWLRERWTLWVSDVTGSASDVIGSASDVTGSASDVRSRTESGQVEPGVGGGDAAKGEADTMGE